MSSVITCSWLQVITEEPLYAGVLPVRDACSDCCCELLRVTDAPMSRVTLWREALVALGRIRGVLRPLPSCKIICQPSVLGVEYRHNFIVLFHTGGAVWLRRDIRSGPFEPDLDNTSGGKWERSAWTLLWQASPIGNSNCSLYWGAVFYLPKYRFHCYEKLPSEYWGGERASVLG
ncbi:MAG: hypothetical protein K0R57_1815 [Paenibacillaceae bacterium]|jgi:hypothetical protein|nr:hypothetical protein [Paenibacillaceae bacterium]